MRSLLYLFLTLVLLQSTYAEVVESRIVGGTTASITSMPYIVSLRRGGRHICGGTLITPRHVVTAAHCVAGRGPRTLTITGGTGNLKRGGVTVRVARIFSPKSFNSKTMNTDIAVLKLAKNLTGNNIKTIKLCNSGMKVGSTLKVSGWGVTSENSNRLPDQLRTVNVPIIQKSKCQRQYRRKLRLTNSMVCAARMGRDSCSGDSGGPAVQGGRLCGVVSFGYGCARPNFAGVYTDIRKMRKFIRAALKK